VQEDTKESLIRYSLCEKFCVCTHPNANTESISLSRRLAVEQTNFTQNYVNMLVLACVLVNIVGY